MYPEGCEGIGLEDPILSLKMHLPIDWNLIYLSNYRIFRSRYFYSLTLDFRRKVGMRHMNKAYTVIQMLGELDFVQQLETIRQMN